MSRGVRILVSSVVVLALALFAFASARVAERGRFVSPYSTHGGGPDGALALMRLADELGYPTAPFARELSHLRATGTLVAIGGCRGGLVRELTRPEREELSRWVEAGGLLIVAGVPEYVPSSAALSQDRPPTCQEEGSESWLDGVFRRAIGSDEASSDRAPYWLEAQPVGPPLAHMAPFEVSRAFTVRAGDDVEPTILLSSPVGTLGMTVAVGRGRVVLLGTADALTNDTIAGGGGVVFARLLEAFAPKGPVWFDEYHLGMGERRSLIRYLRELGYGAPLTQLAVVLLVGLVAFGVRLGEPRRERRPPARNTRRYLAALGILYARTRDKKGALEVLSQRALTRVATHYRVVNVPLDQLASFLHGQGLGAVADYARRIEEHGHKPLTRGESLRSRARQIDEDATAAIVLGDAS